MSKKLILVAPNSFKECAGSVRVSHLIADSLKKHLKKKFNNFTVLEKPVSDGGDGFLDVCRYYFDTTQLHFEISFPWGNDKFDCSVEYSQSRQTIFVESAKVLGLSIIPEEKRKPLELSSKGLGELLDKLNKANQSGIDIKKVVIGIGGTGTSDLGIGACSAFGMKLTNKNGKEIKPVPEYFPEAYGMIWQKPYLSYEIETILDVENPLLGMDGANYVFAKQKGASDFEIEYLEKGFENILKLAGAQAVNKLSGAGGGLAAGLHLFLDAKQIYAEDFIKNYLGINRNKIFPDILITGEGKFDRQTMMKKGAAIILNEFQNSNCDIFLIVGSSEVKLENVNIIELISFFEDKTESIQNFEKGIDFACNRIVNEYLSDF